MRKARVALIGLGGWGGTQSRPAVGETGNLELVTWFDANSDVVAECRDKMPVPPAASFDEVLDNEDVEGVILIVPNHIHKQLTIQAAGRGKHVWIEKPVANTVAEADAMIQACEDAGVILQVGHSLRRQPAVRLMREMIEDGKIGELAMLEAHQSHRGGWTLTPEQWRWYNEKCPGGPLNLLGIHQIDNFNYLLGGAEEVTAMASKRVLDCEIDEIYQTTIRFRNGVLGHIGDTYITPGKTWIAAYGTTGWIEYNFLTNALTVFDIDGKPEQIEVEAINLIVDQFREFGECIVTGKRPETSGIEARAAVAIMEAAIESARTGKTVKL